MQNCIAVEAAAALYADVADVLYRVQGADDFFGEPAEFRGRLVVVEKKDRHMPKVVHRRHFPFVALVGEEVVAALGVQTEKFLPTP